jgi:NADH-quinone oxidoreductase subunit N
MTALGPHGLPIGVHHVHGPHIDWASLSPIVVLAGGALVVLLVGLISARFVRVRVVPLFTIITLGGAIGTEIWRFPHAASIISGALRIDDLALIVDIVCAASAIAAVLLALRGPASEEAGHGEFHALLLFSVMGMAVFISAQDLITLFIGIELLSIPLYVLCASEHRREASLESGLKYLVIGSVGSATLVYGLAMIYGATGTTSFSGIASHLTQSSSGGGVLGDPLMFVGLGLVVVGFAFKASVAPFHQWTPDVYEGAPTPVTAFMATATKAAAIAVFLRFFDVAAISAQGTWSPLIAAIAAITIIVGNAGALGQSSLKRMLGYSGVAQAGYLLAGVVVGTRLGVSATILYVIVYAIMNLAAFAAIVGVELESGAEDLDAIAGLGARRPLLAWPLTVAMLALAGIPGTVGFIGKFQLIHALVNGNYTWLAIVLVIGSMISLGYYLRVIAAMWMGRAQTEDSAYPSSGIALAPIAGGSPEADEQPAAPVASGAADRAAARTPWSLPLGPAHAAEFAEAALVAVVFGAATVFFGIIPGPLFHFAAHAGAALTGLF